MINGFDPQRLDHWLFIATFLGLSSWILWTLYFRKENIDR